MAKISAHGHVVGTVEYLTRAKRYMSDGTVLINHGFGWKIGGRLKVGVQPGTAYERCAERLREKLAVSPATAAYRRALHAACGMSKRWRLHAAVELMPDDPDGVWSEVCDGCGDNVHADVDEIVELCALYRTHLNELSEHAERSSC